MERKQLEQLQALVRAVAKTDQQGGGGPGLDELWQLDRAIAAELNPPAIKEPARSGIHLEWAPKGTAPELVLVVRLSADLRICTLNVSYANDAPSPTAVEAARAAFRLGFMSTTSTHEGAQQP